MPVVPILFGFLFGLSCSENEGLDTLACVYIYIYIYIYIYMCVCVSVCVCVCVLVCLFAGHHGSTHPTKAVLR